MSNETEQANAEETTEASAGATEESQAATEEVLSHGRQSSWSPDDILEFLKNAGEHSIKQLAHRLDAPFEHVEAEVSKLEADGRIAGRLWPSKNNPERRVFCYLLQESDLPAPDDENGEDE